MQQTLVTAPQIRLTNVRIEPAKIADIAFVIDSWCNDENISVGRPSEIDEQTFKVGQRARVLRLLSSSSCAVARDLKPAEPGKDLLGWCLYSFDRATLRPIVHFTYVKAKARRQGIAGALLQAAGVRPEKGAWCTHNRAYLRKAVRRSGLVYNPYLLDYDPTKPTPQRRYVSDFDIA